MTRVAITIKTLLRESTLRETIDAIREHVRDVSYRIYVADDGPVSDTKRALYDELREQGHVVLELEPDVGASAARNALVERSVEEFVLRLDDDFVVGPETHLGKMVRILERVPELGALADLERDRHGWKGAPAGCIREAQGAMEILDRTLHCRFLDHQHVRWEKVDGLRFRRAGFTRNFLLLRRAMLEDGVRWDDRLKIHREHADFMLQIQRHPRWELAFTPESVHVHGGPPPGTLPAIYSEQRYRGEEEARRLFREKWGVDEIVTHRPRRALSERLRRELRRALRRVGLGVG